jgi:hypothetical protein
MKNFVIPLSEHELDNEIWRSIPRIKGYLVSDMGRVKSLKNPDLPIILKECVAGGYMSVGLRVNGVTKTTASHLLVGLAFLRFRYNPKKLKVMDHIDENRFNNRLNNFQIITHRKNVLKSRPSSNVRTLKNGFSSHVNIGKTKHYLGTYQTFEHAREIYEKSVIICNMAISPELKLERVKNAMRIYKNKLIKL